MLTDNECKNATCPAGASRERLPDSGGLYLEISPKGSKRWFWKYRLATLERRLSLGGYPEVSLKQARQLRDKAKALKAQGKDPVQFRKVEKLKASNPLGNTFQEVALEWFERQKGKWGQTHATRAKRQLERDLFPWIGERRLNEIEPVELLATLRKIEARGAIETADRGLMLCRQIWRYGVATGRVSRDMTPDLKGALTPYGGKKHFAAITDPTALGVLLRAIQAYRGTPIVRAALQLAPLLFQRPGELRAAAWAEIDLENKLWTIPSIRMKRTQEGKLNGEPHTVPLSTQAVQILRDLQPYSGHGVLVFPGERSHDRPISENSVRTALISMGYTPEKHTWHGFRATARTMLAERLDIDPLIIEAQLAHSVKDSNGRAYNRTTYLAQRMDMMQRWADYLEKLCTGANVIELRGKAA
jgi:integrase